MPFKLTRVLSGMTLLSSMSNPAPSDNVVLRHAVEQIQRCLPGHWSTSVATKTNDVADARLTIKTPAGASAALAIGARRQLDPRLVAEVAGALQDGGGRRVRRHRAVPGAAHPRAAGRRGARVRRPGRATCGWCSTGRRCSSRRAARSSSPWAAPRTVAVAARGQGQPAGAGAGGRAKRPLGVRQLAALAGTDPGYVSRLLDLFHREELIEREPRGPVVAVHARAADPALGRGLPVRRRAPVRAGRAPARRAGRAGARCATPAIPHALTARAGAAALLGDGAARRRRRLRRQSRARRGGDRRRAGGHGGANLLLIDPFDPFVFDGTLGGVGPALRGARADHRRPARQPGARAGAGGQPAATIAGRRRAAERQRGVSVSSLRSSSALRERASGCWRR